MSGVQFVTVNFDKDRDFLRSHRVANQSVILVFKDGKEVARIAGITAGSKIRSLIKKAL